MKSREVFPGFAVRCVVLGLAVLGTATVKAQPDIVEKFERRSHRFMGLRIAYALFVPEGYDSSRAYPLVLALHGSGEGGTDYRHLMKNRLATAWADPANQTNWPAFVVAPQASWFGWNSEEGSTTVIHLLDSLAVEFNIDRNRVYLTGWSAGGGAAFNYASWFPGRFAAIVPMSSTRGWRYAYTLRDVPIWAFLESHDWSGTLVSTFWYLETEDRQAVFTHCNRWNCQPLPDSALREAIEQHASLIVTQHITQEHNVVDVSLAHPRLFPWVFSQYLSVPDAIQITTPAHYPSLTGTHLITWSAENPADSIEIWVSTDNRESFELVEVVPNTGRYNLNTLQFADTPVALLRLFLRNTLGYIYGRETSGRFVIDNPGLGMPFVRIDDELVRMPVRENAFDLRFLAADPESSSLSAELYFSADSGVTFAQVASFEVESDTIYQTRTVDLDALPNTSNAVLRLEVSDDDTTIVDTSVGFVKHTPRRRRTNVEHPAGRGDATIVVHLIDPARLTDHRYRITFDDEDPEAKTYTVVDLQTGVTRLEDVPMSDGVLESPLFDGIRLVVQDREETTVDLERTGWIQGNTDLVVSIDAPVLDQGIGVPKLVFLATPTDYRMEITSTVSDTSVAGVPMQFTVTNMLTGQSTAVQFLDRDGDRLPSPSDYLYVLEPNEAGRTVPAWRFRFSGGPSTVAPAPGDIFLMRTIKPVTAEDVYEFQAALGTAREEGRLAPTEFRLLQNYPNPFNPSTRIEYALPVTTHVRITVYDLLGRKVAELVNGQLPMGKHSAVWNAEEVGSGVYFCRFEAGTFVETKSMFLLK